MSSRLEASVPASRARCRVFVVATVIACLGVGCVAPGRSAPANAELVARDLANAIEQLPGVAPASTRLMFASDTAPADPTLEALQRRLAAVGFGGDAANRSDVSVDHRRTALPDVAGEAWRVEIAVGPVRLRRDYRETVSGPRPLSPLLVRGADASVIRSIDEQLYGLSEPASTAPLAPAAPAAPPEPAAPPPVQATRPDMSVNEPPDVVVLAAAIEHEAVPAEATSTVRLERTIDFPRGSTRLSNRNVEIIDEVLARYRDGDHLIAVFGTSLGTRAAADDNRATALTRASRVKRAFVAAGVPTDRVLVSALWLADEARPDVPIRGAVLQLRGSAP